MLRLLMQASLLVLVLFVLQATGGPAPTPSPETARAELTGLEGLMMRKLCDKTCRILGDPSAACSAACIAGEEYDLSQPADFDAVAACREICVWIDSQAADCQPACLTEYAGEKGRKAAAKTG